MGPNVIEQETSYLFVYGTLAPVSPEDAERDGAFADAVRGRLYDFGAHPALVDLDDPSAGWVEAWIRPVAIQVIRDELDPYEGVAEGLFHRLSAKTRAGRVAWVYVWARELPQCARGPIAQWAGPRNSQTISLITRRVPDSPGA
jgi:gamma-glutamylcyclotransferase (GGCT)/AIG2-like uncharacterized protein YtfP